MFYQILYLLLAAFGFGLLVFIHEWGHYIVARREGMDVEVFAIGFGKPIVSWKIKGVKWQICMIPLGGYVQIKGQGQDGKEDPYKVKDGFFSKSPWARIKVALAGPVVNILFALFAFSVIWMSGGRDKPFAEYTRIVGYVENKSAVYEKGIRPGDQILQYDGRSESLIRDLTYAAVMGGDQAHISGYQINYEAQIKHPFDITVPTYPHPSSLDQSMLTSGILVPANYLIFANTNEIDGIDANDRLVAIDGEMIFSNEQLSSFLNSKTALLTVQRGDHIFLSKVPRIAVSDIRFSPKERGNLDDWKSESVIGEKLDSLLYIPYSVNSSGVVTSPLSYVDENTSEHPHLGSDRSPLDIALEAGDHILAVDGIALNSGRQLLQELQTKRVQLIVQKDPALPIESWKVADSSFDKEINWKDLNALNRQIGFTNGSVQEGNLFLISGLIPKTFTHFLEEQGKETLLIEQEEKIAQMTDPVARAEAKKAFEKAKNRLMLGISLRDREISYNPSPLTLFGHSLEQTGRTLKGLVTGTLNPKWMSGPVGIMHVMHHGWSLGFSEALYYMGLISLGLAILNLLPIPILDGGRICFFLYEIISRRKISVKVMEKVAIPCVILIIGFFIFVTYHDITRLIHRFF